MRNATDYPVPGRATAGWQAAGTTVDRTPGAGACLIEWRRALGPSRGQHLRGGHLAGGGARIRGTCPIGLPGRPASSGYRPISACPLFGMDARPQRFARPLGPGERLAQRGRERQVPEPHGAHRRSAPAGAAGAAGLSRGPDTMVVAKGCVTHSPRCDAVASMEWVGEGCRRATRRNDRGRRGFAGPPARIRDRLPTPVDAAVVAISHRAYRPRTRNDSIRTVARTLVSADLLEVADPPRYQAIAPQALKLRGLGYPDTLIAACTGVTSKTVAKAIRWFENRSSVLD